MFRVSLDHHDLRRFGITVLDLLGNHQQLESFFKNLIQQIDPDHYLQTSKLLNFQIFPVRDYLVILVRTEQENSSNSFNSRSKLRLNRQVLVKSTNFDDLIKLANCKVLICVMESSLYLYRDQYYLNLRFQEVNSRTKISNLISVIHEYTDQTKIPWDTVLHFGRPIKIHNALKTIRYYFK